MRNVYTAFGLGIESGIHLPGFLLGAHETDVTVSRGPVPESLEGGTQVELFGWAAKGSYLMSMPGHARFLVMEDTITVEEVSGGDGELVSQLVERACLGVLLQLRGYLVLQGSAVELGGKGVAIVSEPSMGASTLAYALVREGARLLSDGLVAVKLGGNGTPELYPASSSLQLWSDMISAFGEEPDSFRRVRSGLERRIVPLSTEKLATGKVPLGTLVFQGKHPQEGMHLRECTGMKKIKSLLKCTHKRKLEHFLGTAHTHFGMAMITLQKTRASVVLFPSGSPFCAPELARIVLEEL